MQAEECVVAGMSWSVHQSCQIVSQHQITTSIKRSCPRQHHQLTQLATSNKNQQLKCDQVELAATDIGIQHGTRIVQMVKEPSKLQNRSATEMVQYNGWQLLKAHGIQLEPGATRWYTKQSTLYKPKKIANDHGNSHYVNGSQGQEKGCIWLLDQPMTTGQVRLQTLEPFDRFRTFFCLPCGKTKTLIDTKYRYAYNDLNQFMLINHSYKPLKLQRFNCRASNKEEDFKSLLFMDKGKGSQTWKSPIKYLGRRVRSRARTMVNR